MVSISLESLVRRYQQSSPADTAAFEMLVIVHAPRAPEPPAVTPA